VQAVELVALPEGVPEVLHVTCNGRSGRLLVRTQRVQHGDSEISASKFEQVCGKGDAKKWKCSIWIEGEDGSQVMVGELYLVSKLNIPQHFVWFFGFRSCQHFANLEATCAPLAIIGNAH